jgi:transglutaminase superfamily protein
MGRVSKFLRLSGTERRLVIGAACALWLMRLGLWTLPSRTVRRAVARSARPRDTARSSGRPSAERVAWAIAVAVSCVPGARNCLVKALAGEFMLGRFGYPSQLRIGAAKTLRGEFEAHAWLESGGKVLLGQCDLGRYTEMVGPGRGGSL